MERMKGGEFDIHTAHYDAIIRQYNELLVLLVLVITLLTCAIIIPMFCMPFESHRLRL